MLVLCVFIYTYLDAHVYTYRRQKMTPGPCSGWALGSDLCPLQAGPALAGGPGRIIGGAERSKPFLCVCWHISTPHPYLNIASSLLFIPAHNKLLPSLQSCIYECFSRGNLQALSAAKVIKISVTSAHSMPCMLNISFIINIRCQLNTVTVTLKYPTLNSECLTSKVRSGP